MASSRWTSAEGVRLVHGHGRVLQRPLTALAAVVVEDQVLIEVVEAAHGVLLST